LISLWGILPRKYWFHLTHIPPLIITGDFPKVRIGLHCRLAVVIIFDVKRQVLSIVVVPGTTVGVDNCVEIVSMGDKLPEAALVANGDVGVSVLH